MRYRIEWKMLENNYQGHGSWFNCKKLLEDHIYYLNKTYHKDMLHWIGQSSQSD